MFKVPVKIEGIERRRRSVTAFHFFAGFFFIAAVTTGFITSRYMAVIVFLLLTGFVSILYSIGRKKIDPSGNYSQIIRMLQVIGFILAGFFMSESGTDSKVFFVWASGCIVLLVVERKIFKNTNVTISGSGIHLPGFFTTHIMPWHVLEKFVLRPDYLTMFRTNQKYVQLEVLKLFNPDEINEINHFCEQQIEKTRSSAE